MTSDPSSTLAAVVALSAFADSVRAQEIEAALLAQVGEYVDAVEAAKVPAVAALGSGNHSGDLRNPGGGGGVTQAQGGIDFDGLANCEGSGINGWRTGLYGLETGTNDVGSWSIEAQQAKVREIYAQYGANAWGVNCRRFFGG